MRRGIDIVVERNQVVAPHNWKSKLQVEPGSSQEERGGVK